MRLFPKFVRGEQPLYIYAITVVSVILFPFLVYALNFHGNLSKDGANWGQFGDFIGGVLNPIIGMATIFALLHNIHLARLQIAEEKKKFVAQQLANEAQLQAAIDQHRIDLRSIYEGALPGFLEILQKLDDVIFANEISLQVMADILELSTIKVAAYEIDRKGHGWSKLLRTLHQILRFIYIKNPDKGIEIDEPMKWHTSEFFMASLIRTNLHQELVLMIAIYGWAPSCKHPRWEFKSFIERYGLLEQLINPDDNTKPRGLYVSKGIYSEILSYYKESAFKPPLFDGITLQDVAPKNV